jgi:hypothetical protein
MWTGILVEGGAGRLALRPEVLDSIEALDAHGIYLNITTKKTAEAA